MHVAAAAGTIPRRRPSTVSALNESWRIVITNDGIWPNMSVVSVKATATPSIPNSLPTQMLGTRAMSTAAFRSITTCGFPAASSTASFHAINIWHMIITHRICTVGTAGRHCEPKAKGITSGATAMRPKSAGSPNGGEQGDSLQPHVRHPLLVLAQSCERGVDHAPDRQSEQRQRHPNDRP